MSNRDVNTINLINEIIQLVMHKLLDLVEGRRLHFHAANAPLGTGSADLLLMDSEHHEMYVVEIILEEATGEDVGRLLSHIGWLKKHAVPIIERNETDIGFDLSSHPDEFGHIQDVKGILLASRFGTGALYALDVCPVIKGKTFRYSIELSATGL